MSVADIFTRDVLTTPTQWTHIHDEIAEKQTKMVYTTAHNGEPRMHPQHKIIWLLDVAPNILNGLTSLEPVIPCQRRRPKIRM